MYAALREPYLRQNPEGIYSRPDPALSTRLNGLLELFGKAQMIGVQGKDGNLTEKPLEADGPGA